MATAPEQPTDEVTVILRATRAQRSRLQAEAAAQGMSAQELLELRVFGEIRPRQRKRRHYGRQEALQLDVA